MSNHTVPAAEKAASHPVPSNGTPHPSRTELTPEAKEALVARARAILAGRMPAPPLPVPEWIGPYLAQQFAGYEPPPTAEAINYLTEQMALPEVFRGDPVVVHRTDAGVLTVLARGDAEVLALLHALEDEERARVLMTDTM
jgi:hypothetical protein